MEENINETIDLNNMNTNHNKGGNKKKIIVISAILIAIIAIVAIGVGVFFATNKKDKTGKEDKKDPTIYQRIYIDKDKTMYYANCENQIKEIKGHRSVDEYFFNNVAVAFDSKFNYYLIDINGNTIVQPETYKYISRCSYDKSLYEVKKEKKYGIINYKGEIVVPIEYDNATDTYISGKDIVLFAYNNKENKEYKVFTTKGKELFKSDKEIDRYDISSQTSGLEGYPRIIQYENKIYDIDNGKLVLELKENQQLLTQCIVREDNNYKIYDKNYKLKKEYKNVGNCILTPENGGFKISGDTNLFIDSKGNIKELEKEEKEEKIEEFVKIPGHYNYKIKLKNGDKYIAIIDKEDNRNIIKFHDAAGNLKYTYDDEENPKIRKIEYSGNYFNIITTEYSIILDENFKVVQKIKDPYDKLYSYEFDNGELYYAITCNYDKDEVLFNDDFCYTFERLNFHYQKNNTIIVYERNKKIANIINEKYEKTSIENVENIEVLIDDYYLLVLKDGSRKVLNSKTAKISFEFKLEAEDLKKTLYVPIDYKNSIFAEKYVSLIETHDGFYTLEGKLVLNKKD